MPIDSAMIAPADNLLVAKALATGNDPEVGVIAFVDGDNVSKDGDMIGVLICLITSPARVGTSDVIIGTGFRVIIVRFESKRG